MRETTAGGEVRGGGRLNHAGPPRPLCGHWPLRSEEGSLHWKALSRRVRNDSAVVLRTRARAGRPVRI